MRNQDMPQDPESTFLTPKQAADLLKISLSTLKKLIYQDKIKTFKTPGGHHRILKNDLLNMHKGADLFSTRTQITQIEEDGSLEIIEAFSSIIEGRHKFGRGHAAAVSETSCQIAESLSLSKSETHRISKAAFLHDIGMIAVPESILNKNTPLKTRDLDIIKTHPLSGARMLSAFSMFADIIPIIKQHHERPDGKGYPYGLKGTHICIEAKIIAVAEAFDSMTSDSSYKEPMAVRNAMDHIKKAAGSHFDPSVANAFLKCMRNNPEATIV